jgi:hypothetical protein
MGLYATAVIKVFDEVAIAKNESAESTVIDLTNLREDAMSLQVEVTGDGEVDLTYLSSINGTDFMAFDSVDNTIKASITKTSGPGSDGKILLTFTPKLSEKIKIVAEEQNANSVVISAWLLTR